jgi:hypothetical protein
MLHLIGVRDGARFSREITRHSLEHPTDERPAYRDVLAWVIDAIVGVITARLGTADPGQTFILAVHSPGGDDIDVDDLPASGRRVLRTVAAFLAEDPAQGHRSLTATAQQTDPTTRAETLADALIWLDFLLDVDLPDPPDVPTH